MSIDRDQSIIVPDDNEIAVPRELIAVNDLTFRYDANRGSFDSRHINPVVKACTARAVSRYRTTQQWPNKRRRDPFLPSSIPITVEHGISRSNDFDRQLPRRSGDKDQLSDLDLARILDSVDCR
jgi:hypothetical protein